MSYIDHIRACNNAVLGRFVPLLVDEQRVGWLRPEFVAKLSNWPDVFEIAAEPVHTTFLKRYYTKAVFVFY